MTAATITVQKLILSGSRQAYYSSMVRAVLPV